MQGAKAGARVVGVVLLIAAAMAAAWRFDWLGPGPDPQAARFSGNVDIREVSLAFRVAGRVERVEVDEGTPVAPGQVLARLDAEPLENSVAEARAALDAAEARRDLLDAGYRGEDIARLRSVMEARQAVHDNARAFYDRQARLAGTGAIAATVLDDARSARDTAAAQLEAARQEYDAARHGFRPEERRQAAAEAELARARLASAQLALADTVLRAPEAGIVLVRAIEPGAILAAGTPAFSISLQSPVWVRAYASEPELGRIAPGAWVLVHTDARPGRPYEGVVGFVSPVAEFTPKQVETEDLRTGLVYRFRVVLRDPDTALRQGMPVTVSVPAAGG